MRYRSFSTSPYNQLRLRFNQANRQQRR